nr:ribonuclease R [Lichenibacterium sp. 6Y81]
MAREAALIAEGKGSVVKSRKREVARAFNIKGSDRIALKRMLRELEEEGQIGRRRSAKRGEAAAGALPAMVVADIVSRDRDGDLVARPIDWPPEQGPAPRILVHVPKLHRPGRAVPGVGERALLRLEPTADAGPDDPALTGRVVKMIARDRARLLGVVRLDRDGSGRHNGARVQAVDKKNASEEYFLPEEELAGAEDGELVAIEPIGRQRVLGLQSVRVAERLGSLKGERAVSTIAILTHGIPHVFRPETLAEAGRVEAPGLAGREDWRALPLITIDPPDAKDHDDAVHAAMDDAADNPGGMVVTVAIADVASLVAPGSAMDREAVDRGNSVYFPDRVVPMLPERVSTDLGSLRPGVDRPALAVRLVLSADGEKRRHSFHRVMIRSAAKLSYAQAQAAIDGTVDDATAPLLDPVLRPLWEAYRLAHRAREGRSPLDLDLPERKLVLNRDGTVDRVAVPERLDSHRLIEEFMILANVAAAETLEDKRQVLVYRVHDEPSLTKLNALSEFLQTIGIKLAKGQVLRPAQFNGILGRVKDTEHEHLVNEVVLRSQAQAEYAVENYGHFGLNLRRYAHFTSPIRRYADLVVHRALIRALGLGSDGLPDTTPQELGETAARISAAERRAMAAERETIDRLIAGFLSEKIGATFAGRLSGVTKAGLFVRLVETGADGFVPAAHLGDEYFSFDEPGRAMVGTRTGTTYRLGDEIEVRLVEVAPVAGALRFEVVGGGQRRARRGGNGPRADRAAGRPSSEPLPWRRSRRHR